MCTLQGVTSAQVEAMPTCGLAKSASVKPTARNMALLGARVTPSTIGAGMLAGLVVVHVKNRPCIYKV
jgi:hypothetical protein